MELFPLSKEITASVEEFWKPQRVEIEESKISYSSPNILKEFEQKIFNEDSTFLHMNSMLFC